MMQCFCGLNVYETHEALLSSTPLLLVSDGSVDSYTGWIISDNSVAHNSCEGVLEASLAMSQHT
jgi:hypothetical protein